MCIDPTNEHAEDYPEFQKLIRQMETNIKGRAFLMGFLRLTGICRCMVYDENLNWSGAEVMDGEGG